MTDQNKAINAIIEHGIDNIDNGFEGTEAADLHHHLYNEDYFIVGTYPAEQFLQAYGTFDAIRDVRQYEDDTFGEVTTDLGEPEKVANMLAYIKGEEALNDCITLQNNIDEKLTAAMLEGIKLELEAQLTK